jgi:molybdenum-dependent DNA-binding transcriptional regulator ModE
MDSLEALNAFVRAAEARSFTVAGRQLGVSSSAIGKAIARMEERLGVRLFHRSTRSITLTADGALFLERCRRIVSEIEAAELELSRAAPNGRGKYARAADLYGRTRLRHRLSAGLRHRPATSRRRARHRARRLYRPLRTPSGPMAVESVSRSQAQSIHGLSRHEPYPRCGRRSRQRATDSRAQAACEGEKLSDVTSSISVSRVPTKVRLGANLAVEWP